MNLAKHRIEFIDAAPIFDGPAIEKEETHYRERGWRITSAWNVNEMAKGDMLGGLDIYDIINRPRPHQLAPSPPYSKVLPIHRQYTIRSPIPLVVPG